MIPTADSRRGAWIDRRVCLCDEILVLLNPLKVRQGAERQGLATKDYSSTLV